VRIAAAFAGLIAFAGSAHAGDILVSQLAPRPDVIYAAPRHYDVATVVRSLGLEPTGAPVRTGVTWVQRATDLAGTPLRVVVDARSGTVLAIHPVMIEPSYRMAPSYGRPYVYGPPPPYAGPPAYRGPYGAPYGPYAAAPRPYEYDDEDVMPPRAAPHARAPHASDRSAAVNPRPPLPKPRPQAAPAEAKAPMAQKPVAAAPQATKPAAPNTQATPNESKAAPQTFAPLYVP
jgi:hypothetical protein